MNVGVTGQGVIGDREEIGDIHEAEFALHEGDAAALLIEFFDEAPDVGDVDWASDDEEAVGAAVGDDADFGGGWVGIGGIG